MGGCHRRRAKRQCGFLSGIRTGLLVLLVMLPPTVLARIPPSSLVDLQVSGFAERLLHTGAPVAGGAADQSGPCLLPLYTTGKDGVTDPSVPWQGPIPPGNYSLDTSQISEGGFLRNLLGDWGKYRAPLTPDSSTNTYGRDGFFLHGGKNPGSAGCIDVGSGDKTLFPNLMGHDGPIPVTVK